VTIVTHDVVRIVQQTLTRSPRKSFKKTQGKLVYISTTPYRRAAEQLKLQSFRFQPVHQLRSRDAAVRINHCRRFRGVWPSQSPDLTSPAFFPGAFLKEGVYSHNPKLGEPYM